MRRLLSRIRSLSFADAVAAGLGLVVGLLFCAVIIVGLGAHAARDSAENLKNQYLPFMETALSLERLVYEAVFHGSIFGVSGDMASYSGARIQFPAIRNAADLLALRAMAVPGGQALARDMEVLRDLAAQFDLVVEKHRTLNDQLAVEQAALQKTADAMNEILLDVQARVASAGLVAERAGKGNDSTLDEKARLLALNGFSLAVAEVTGRVQTAGVAKNAEGLVKAQASFTLRWEEAREACAEAVVPPSPDGISAARTTENPVDAMESLAAAYAERLRSIRFNLEESARVTQDRISLTGRLTALTRNILVAAREVMAAAADRTDTALRGATATLLACVLLACLVGVGAAVLFLRLKVNLLRQRASS